MKTLKSKLSLKVQIPKIVATGTYSQTPNPRIQSECTLIVDNIYVGGYESSINYEFLKQNNITHIVNCAGGSSTFKPLYFSDFTYLTIDLRDEATTNIFEAVTKFITFIKNLDDSHKILIHCSQGVSRAPALVCAYLMWKMNLDSESAFNFVKKKRECVDINLGFMFQLNNLSRDFFKQIV